MKDGVDFHLGRQVEFICMGADLSYYPKFAEAFEIKFSGRACSGQVFA